MSYRRPYYEYDANLEFRRIVWLDLDDPVSNSSVIFEEDLRRPGGVIHQATRGRVTEQLIDEARDRGDFPHHDYRRKPIRPVKQLG